MACKLVGTVKGTKLFGSETVLTPLNLEALQLLPKPRRHRYPSERGAQFPQA